MTTVAVGRLGSCRRERARGSLVTHSVVVVTALVLGGEEKRV